MILLNVVPLSFLQKHFTYKRWTGNNWVILFDLWDTVPILHAYAAFICQEHGLQRNGLGFNDSVMLQFKTFLAVMGMTKW